MDVIAPPAPSTIVAAVARHLADEAALAGDRVYAGRAPGELGPSSAPYVEVTHVAGPTPIARGDGETLAYDALVQVDAWELPTAEDPELTSSILLAVSGRRLPAEHGSRGWRVDLVTATRTEAEDHAGWVRQRIDVRVTINR